MKSQKMDTQPSIHENMTVNGSSNTVNGDIIARAAAANAAAMGRNRSNYQATFTSPIASPSPTRSSWMSAERGSLRTRRTSSYFGRPTMNGRRTTSTFKSNGHFESGDIVKEHYHSIKDRCHRELGVGIGFQLLDTSHADLRHWISNERLMRLPHKGSSWDRVLISAQHFADQVDRLGMEIESFAPDSFAASNLVFGQCLLLLEKVSMSTTLSSEFISSHKLQLGHENASALETAFALFYQIGIEISPLLRRESGSRQENILEASNEIMGHISQTFSQMLTIVADVTMALYGAIHRMAHVEQVSTKLDIYARFGHHIESFRASVRRCAHEMWRFVLERSGDDVEDVLVLQAWLAPQDTILAQLSYDHVNLASRAEEYTCTWLQAHLNSFFKGDDKCLLVQGKSGSGKTTMANWVVDRLQRPMNRVNISILSFFFSKFEIPVFSMDWLEIGTVCPLYPFIAGTAFHELALML